jgi:hypothetical protein
MKKSLLIGLTFCASIAQALVVNNLTTITVNEGLTNSIEGYVVGSNTLVKSGPGCLIWTNAFTFAGETRLEAGSLKMVSESFNMADPVLTNLLGQSVFWVDAADDTSFTYNTTTNVDLTVTTNSVETWKDKLSRNTAIAGTTNVNRQTKPIRTLNAKNGLPIVNFGAAGTGGSSMSFTRISTIRTVFWVTDIDASAQQFLLGDDGSVYHFHRGPTNPTYWSAGNASPYVVNGATYNNGLRIASPTVDLIPTGYQLISLVTSGNVQANAFCNDRNISARYGGQRIAELLIYDKALTDAERKAVETYLRKKWNTATEDTSEFNRIYNLTIAGSDTVIATGVSPVLVETFRGSGSVNFLDGALFSGTTTLTNNLSVTAPSPLTFPTLTGTNTFTVNPSFTAGNILLVGELVLANNASTRTLQAVGGSGTLTVSDALTLGTLAPSSVNAAIRLVATDRITITNLTGQGRVDFGNLPTTISNASVVASQTLTMTNGAASVAVLALSGAGTLALDDVSVGITNLNAFTGVLDARPGSDMTFDTITNVNLRTKGAVSVIYTNTIPVGTWTGEGTITLSQPVSITAMTVTNTFSLDKDARITTLMGNGTFSATALIVDTVTPANTANALVIDIPAVGRTINKVMANGGKLQVPDLLTVTNKIQVGGGQTLVLANSANGLTVPQLTGNGAITLPGGTYTIGGIFAATNEILTINYGADVFVAPALSGTGKVKFVGTGSLTLNQPDQFVGTIELPPDIAVTITGTNPFLNKLEIHGTNTLIFPAGMTDCGVTNLIGNGQLQGTNTAVGVTMHFNRIDMTGNIYLIDAGVGPLTVPDVRGAGILTSNRGVAYDTVTLGGTFTLKVGQDTLKNLSGAGTLYISNVSKFGVDNLASGGNVVIVNTTPGAIPVTIATLGGAGSLTVTNGLAETTITNFVAGTDVTFTINAGTNGVTVRRSFGEGTLVKQGSGPLYFGQHSTLQAVRLANDCKIVAIPVDVTTNPVQANLSFWLDASQTNTLTLSKDSANNDGITEWRDVRETYNPWQAASPYDRAYQGTINAAPVIGRYTLNGRNVADMGTVGNSGDVNSRWMQFQKGQTSRTVIMVFGSQAGGNFPLTGASTYNYHRGDGTLNNPLTPIFNATWAIDSVKFGKTYLDGTEVYSPTLVGFNGNYQIFSVVNRSNETAYADRFAYDRAQSGRCGGQRIAEALFYSEKLTDAQRMTVEGYLTAKWKPRMPRLEVATANVEVDTTQSAMAIDVIVGSGNVTKTGANDLTVQDAGGLSGILHISAGKLVTTEALYQQTPTGINNWYDASSVANFTFETDGRIQTWKSGFNSPGSDAQRNSTDLAWSPYYDPYGLNGKSIVDMGVWTGERRLRLANEFVGVCSAFMVYDSRYGGGWLFGARTTTQWSRGDNGGDLSQPMIDGGLESSATRDSILWQNGVQTATNLTQATFKGDWETIALKTPGSVTIGSLGQDRTDASTGLTQHTGGKRLAEVLLYFRTVTTMERLYIERYLNNKWFGRFRNLSFADGTTFELGEGTKDVFVAKLTGSGRVTQTGTSKLDVYDTASFTGTWVADLAKLNLIRKLTPTAPQPTPNNWWLDASNTNTLTLGSGSYATGGVLNTWIDQSGASGNATKVGTVTWRPNMLNGLPIVDLGDALAANYMNYANRTVATGFVIFGSQQGGNFFFGHSTGYNFHRSNGNYANSTAALLEGESNDWAANFLRRGQWKLDGDRFDPRSNTTWLGVPHLNSYAAIPANYAFYSFATRAGSQANTDQLSRDRNVSNGLTGGRQRFAEIIFHSGMIAPTNRAATEAYLMNKWFGKSIYGYVSEKAPLFQTIEVPAGASKSLTINTGVAGQAVAIGTIIGATNITSTGTGKLIVGAINALRSVPTGTEAVVVGRDLPIANPVNDSSLQFWVDANSSSNAFQIGANSRVTRWSDVRDVGKTIDAICRGAFAYDNGTALWGAACYGPKIQTAALNGRNVMDFGKYSSSTWMGFVSDYNSIRNITGIRTVFWVFNSEEGGGWLLGGNGTYNFHRGEPNTAIIKTNPIFGTDITWVPVGLRLGGFYADGQLINPTVTGMSGGWQLFSVVSGEDVQATTFARDRPGDGGVTRTGGQKLAEVLIYNRMLTETERRDVEAYLAYKWFNRVNNGYRVTQVTDVQTVTLAQGSTLTMANANGTFKVGGSGTVTGGLVRVSELSPNTNGITFASGLTLVDGAVVKRAADGTTPNAGKVTVLGGLTVLGGGALNVISISGNVAGQQFQLFGYDTLAGTFAPWSMTGVVTGKYTPKFADNDPANTASVRLVPAGTMILFK